MIFSARVCVCVCLRFNLGLFSKVVLLFFFYSNSLNNMKISLKKNVT